MIIGKVTTDLEVVSELVVIELNRQEKIEAVVDTGFYRCKTELFGLPCWGLSFWLGLG